MVSEIYIGEYGRMLPLDILTGVRNQMLQSPGPSYLDWAFRPSDTVQAGIPWGC